MNVDLYIIDITQEQADRYNDGVVGNGPLPIIIQVLMVEPGTRNAAIFMTDDEHIAVARELYDWLTENLDSKDFFWLHHHRPTHSPYFGAGPTIITFADYEGVIAFKLRFQS